MTTFLLVRHASTATLGHRITGRMPGIRLTDEGRREAAALASSWAGVPMAAVCSSPLERARETASPLAAAQGVPVEIVSGLEEVDYGNWTGRTIEELAEDPAWRLYNEFRSGTRIPGGELALELQQRAVGALEAIRARYENGTVAVVSHSDVIKAVLAFYLGMPLDFVLRLEVDPASVSVLALEEWGPRVRALNTRRPRETAGRR